MPRLLTCLPCQNIIVDREDLLTSVIGIIHGVTVEPFSIDIYSHSSYIPLKWSILCVWEQGLDDAGVTYEQRIQIVLPDGSTFMESKDYVTFIARTNQVTSNVNVMPSSQGGIHNIRVSIRNMDTAGEFQQVFDYPFELKIKSSQGSVNL